MMITWVLNLRRRRDFPVSEEEGKPHQSIMLCLLMADLFIGAAITREAAGMKRNKPTIKDGRTVIRISSHNFWGSNAAGGGRYKH